MALRVLLVEDVEELRATLRQALRLDGRFDVVADVGDGPAAVRAAAELQPDVIVLDLGLPGLAGRELVTSVRDAAPDARVVVYTGAVNAERSGVAGSVDAFVLKDQGVRYLVGLLGDLGRETHFSASIALGPSTDDVRLARRFLFDNCRSWGCSDVVDDAQLVLSELVTNALVHAGPRCELRARFANNLLRLEVRDEGAGTPDLKAPGIFTEGGRGLRIVSTLCQAWGVDTEAPHGKVVWAEMVNGAQSKRRGSDTRSADTPTARVAQRSSDQSDAPSGRDVTRIA